MSRYSSAYRGCRERMTEIVTRLAPGELERRVPACPEWSVKDLLAHVIGVAADFAAGNLEKAGADEWTRAQIASRSDIEVPDLVHEWETISLQVEPVQDLISPGAAGMLIGDAVTHEHDLRGAVGRPGARDSDAVWIALDRYVRRFGKRIKDAGLPSVVVQAGDRRWQAGVLDPEVELDGAAFQLLRALTGRRTIGEITSLPWTGDPGPYTELFSSYPPARGSLLEN
ncbi:MAG: maleylpyruvate isomerase family mycothiol-dependent enzyme [Actinomycetota bacterium]